MPVVIHHIGTRKKRDDYDIWFNLDFWSFDFLYVGSVSNGMRDDYEEQMEDSCFNAGDICIPLD